MGAVYLAEHDVTHEKVAMKELLMTAAADPVAVKRFLQEGEVMQRLGHPNIVAVRDIIEAGGGHYIALEFIAGGSLRDLLKGRPLATPQAFAVMHGLLQALDHAHQHAILPRDVKPQTGMLPDTGRGQGPHPRDAPPFCHHSHPTRHARSPPAEYSNRDPPAPVCPPRSVLARPRRTACRRRPPRHPPGSRHASLHGGLRP